MKEDNPSIKATIFARLILTIAETEKCAHPLICKYTHEARVLSGTPDGIYTAKALAATLTLNTIDANRDILHGGGTAKENGLRALATIDLARTRVAGLPEISSASVEEMIVPAARGVFPDMEEVESLEFQPSQPHTRDTGSKRKSLHSEQPTVILSM